MSIISWLKSFGIAAEFDRKKGTKLGFENVSSSYFETKDIFHTIQHLYFIEDKLKTDPDLFERKLEQTWNNINDDGVYKGEKLEKLNRHVGRERGSNPLEILSNLIAAGYYPPPEVLISIVDTFEKYKKGQGEYTLEECFFGPPTPKAGNYAKRMGRVDLFKRFEVFVSFRKTSERKLLDLACEFVTKRGISMEPESFLRAYNRYKSKDN